MVEKKKLIRREVSRITLSKSGRGLFKDIKRRGLDPAEVLPGVMDGLPGWEKVFLEGFPKAKVQRCQVHLARNVLVKVPKKLKKDIGDELRSIFYASSQGKRLLASPTSSRPTGRRNSPRRSGSWKLTGVLLDIPAIPPEEEWICVRTTNVIERVKKEFKRRIKPL